MTRARAILVAAVALALVTTAAGSTPGGPSTSPAWLPLAGSVDTMLAADGKVFLGGDFVSVAPPFGAFAVYRRGQRSPDAAMARFRDGGVVYAVVDDGTGGFFVGGSFSSFDGVACPNLVHVLASGQVARNWCPRPTVTTVLARHRQVLYAVASAQPKRAGYGSRLLRLDARTGRRLSWHVTVGGSAAISPPNVWTLTPTDTLVFLGGGFASVNGHRVERLAAVDARTGRFVWGADTNGRVNEAQDEGDRLFVGGDFDRVAGKLRRGGLAALDAASGRLLDWQPKRGLVRSSGFAVSPHALYVLAETRQRGFELAAFDLSSGSALWTRPSALLPLALSGRDLVVSSWREVLSLDADNGRPTGAWRAPIRSAEVGDAAISGSRLAIGGDFYTVSPGVPRRGLAALDAATGRPTSWKADVTAYVPYPAADPEVTALAAAGDTLYVGGHFDKIAGQARSTLAAVDLHSGAVLPWQPNAVCRDDFGCDAITATPTAVYVTGVLIGGLEERQAAAFDPGSGALLPWNPGADETVYAVAASGSAVYLGGSFTHPRGQDLPELAAVDPGTGAPTSWRPDPDGPVRTLALQGSTLYAGGDFTHIAGSERLGLAAFDTGTGRLLPWNPGGYLPRRLTVSYHSVVPSGQAVYVQGVPVDATSGKPVPWAPGPGGAETVAVTDSFVYLDLGFGGSPSDWGGLIALPHP
jgi:trimeric autotransporter adhesin